MEETTKEGGLHVAPSARAIGASVKYLSSALVISRVDEMMSLLEAERERGTQTRALIYGLVETMVGASESGFMGIGQRVNEAEARFLADLKTHLMV